MLVRHLTLGGVTTMHVRSKRFLIRSAAALVLCAATAPNSLAPVYAADAPSAPITVDCADPGLADSVAEAQQAAAEAKKAFTDLRGPIERELREQRAEARQAAREARAALRQAKGHSAEDRAAAKAARAALREAERTLRASRREAVRQLQADRREAKAAWDEAKEAFHALRDAAEACADDEATDPGTDEGTDPGTDETTEEPTDGTTVDPTDGTTDPGME
jgi:hypothetical protein